MIDIGRTANPRFSGGSPVNWQNPVTVSLAGAYVMDANSPMVLYDSAGICGNCVPAGSPMQFVKESLVRADAVWFSKAGITFQNRYENSTYNLPSANITILQVIRTTTNIDGSCFGNLDGGASNAQRCQCNNPFSGTVYFDFGGSASPNRVNFTPAGSYYNVWHNTIWTAGSSGMTIYVDGVSQATSATAVTRTNTATGFAIGGAFNSATSGGLNCAVALHLLWTRILTAAEIVSLSLNPWSVFVPQAQGTRGVRYFIPPPAVALQVGVPGIGGVGGTGQQAFPL